MAYPITWLATVLISLALDQEFYALPEILPSLLLWLVPMAAFGFVVSAFAILVVAWIKGWLGKGGPEQNIWSRSSLAVAVTCVAFVAWLVLTM